MDSNPSRNSRGRARCNPLPQVPGNQFPRPGQIQPLPQIPNRPRQPGVPVMPRSGQIQAPRILHIPIRPRQPGVPVMRMPNCQRQPGVSRMRMPNWQQQPGAFRPQIPANGGTITSIQPSSGQPHNQITAPIPQESRPGTSQPQQADTIKVVEQQSNGSSELSTGKKPIPIGRGSVRGIRTAMEYNESNFRTPRPESSLNGKQGTCGEKVNLVANYFPLETLKNVQLYQYRVDFSPEEDRTKVKRGLLGMHQKLLGGYLFDGTSIMFTLKRYDSDTFELTSNRFDDQSMVISITYTNVVDLNSPAYIQVLNVLLRICLRNLGLTQVGRNYYDEEAKSAIEISDGRNIHRLELWPGYKTNFGMFDGGILLCIEIATKIMRCDTVLDFFHECRRIYENITETMLAFKIGVLGSTVLTRYNNRLYIINELDEKSTPQSTFKCKDGTQKTYVEYYQTRWGITIRDCNQPMLVSKDRKLLRNGDDDALVYLVPELCSLTGISVAMRENPRHMRELADRTRVDPLERINKYHDWNSRLQAEPKCKDTLNDWNMTLSKKLVEIEGRILPKEKIFCNNNFYYGDKNADWSDWTKSVRSLPMFTCAKVKRLVVVYPSQYEHNVREFVNTVGRMGNGMSFKLEQPEFISIKNGHIQTYYQALDIVINQINPSLIVCVTLSSRGDTYDLIKRKLCVQRAVPSQIVVLKNVLKNDKSVCTKIAIQINCKLGGAPWKINIPRKGAMIVGFDVCHDKKIHKSYGAFVATINNDHTKYYNCCQPHEYGVEISNYFVSTMTMALHTYKKINGKLPEEIIIYRDGVGDGQLSYVHNIEVKGVKEACAKFYEEEVPLAFIIVKKRINTRYFEVQDGIKNPKPGTVVDTVITDPTMYDFYLISQNVRVGTASPTHYNVIVDTLNDWSPDRMQMLTYKLTHLYFNWSGTISVPAPCQYAHKLAALAAQTLKEKPNVALSELLFFL